MAYRAGSAFIAVSPSFKGFQIKVATEAKKIRPIVLDVDADTTKAIGKIQAIRPQSVKLNVDADTGAARSKIDSLTRNRRTSVNVDADTRAARSKIDGLGRRSILLKVGLALSPIAGPLGAVLAGGAAAVGGIATGVVAGIAGGAAVGTASIKRAIDLQKQLTDASKTRVTALAAVKTAETGLASAMSSAADAQVAAARGVADAERAVAEARASGSRSVTAAEATLADARRQAARTAESTAQAVASAQQQVVAAQDRVRASLESLNAAQAQRLRDLDDMKERSKDNALSIEGADIALIEAQQRLAAAERAGTTGALALRKARLDVAEAENTLADARRQAADDAAALKKAEGDPNSQGVGSAKDQVTQARQDAAAARDELAQARQDADRARNDAARGVAAAETGLARARADAAKSVATAERGLARARSDGARSVAQAQTQVAEAQAKVAEATADVRAADEARLGILDQMTPAQARVLAGIAVLKREWNGFLDSVDRPIAGASLAGMGALEKSLPGLARFIRPVARGLRDVFDLFGNAAASKGATNFAHDMGVFSGGLLRDAGRGALNLARGFGGLLKAFMPLSRDMSKGLVGLTDRFAKWSNGLEGSKGFQTFIGYVREQGPKVLDVLRSLGILVGKVFIALAPLGSAMLSGLQVVIGFLSKLSPGQLLAIAGAITGLFLAFKVGMIAVRIATLEQVTAMGALNVVMDANPIGLVVIAVAALAAGLIYAYKHSETFRTIVQGAWEGIQKVVSWAWSNVIQPVLKAYKAYLTEVLIPVIQFLWKNVVKPVFAAIGNAISWAWSNVIRPVFRAYKAYLTEVLFPVLMFLWKNVVKPVFGALGDIISTVWTDVIRPIFGNMGDGVRGLRTVFENVVSTLGRIWGGLREVFAGPVNWIIKNVINRLIGAVNTVAKRLGHDGNLIDPFGLIGDGGSKAAANPGGKNAQTKNAGGDNGGKSPRISAANGAVLPGWTPGRDVHHFISPTAGSLHLSGGEAVMVPEWTRAVGGPLAVARMNKAARAGGKAFAGGGVYWPVPGHETGTYPGHDGVDINRGSGWDDYGDPIRAYRSGTIVYVGTGRGYGSAIFESVDGGPTVVYGHTSAQFVNANQRVAGGQLIGRVGNTGHSTAPHLHFGVPGGTTAGALALLNGAQIGGQGSAAAGVPSVTGLIGNAFTAIRSALPDVPGGAVGAALAKGTYSTLEGMARSKVASMARSAAKTAFALTPLGVASSVIRKLKGGSPQDTARSMLGSYGWGSDQFGPLNSLWTRESGWNPRALNRSSGAYGIPQSLPGSKMASAGGDWRTNPTTQIKWGLGYIKSTYGSPANAWQHSENYNWYADGGVLPNRLTAYDQGGFIPPGISTVYNGTAKPEPVFTSKQWDDLHAAAAGRSGSGDGMARPINVHGITDPQGVAREIVRLEQWAGVS